MKSWLTFILTKISKRKKFIISALFLSLGLLSIEISNISWRYQAIALLTVLTYILGIWSLAEGLSGVEWFLVLIPPVLFTLSLGIFYFSISSVWFAKILIVILYAVGIYVFLLVGNIFSVAAIRTIQLLRSAQAVSFLLTLVNSFFLYNICLSFRFPFWLNFLLITLISFPLILHGLWCINLEKKITFKLWLHTLIFSLIQGEISMAFSFWPVSIVVGSLALVTALYVGLGLSQQELAERLFVNTIKEYFMVGVVVFLVIFLTTKWGG